MQLHRLNPRELGCAVRARRLADHVLATLNHARLETIRDEEVVKPDRRLVDFKYFNLRPWIVENITRALRLGLHRRHGLRILDIGTGFGYFPYICEFMEQEAEALDINGHRLYDRVIDTLAVKRRYHWIEAFQRLPAPSRPFDYVTAFQIAFNRPDTAAAWAVDEWQFFIEDVFESQLNKGGLLHLELNWSFNIKGWYSEECARLFDRYNARRRGNEIDIFKP